MSSPSFPEPRHNHPDSSADALEVAIRRVASKKDEWAQLGIPERLVILRQLLAGVLDVAPAWVADGCRAKGLSPEESLAGEEWLAGPATTVRNIRLLIEALEAKGQPRPPAVSARPNGQQVARVFPTGLLDKLMFAGVTAEVRILPGKPASQGAIYRTPSQQGKVCGVLGAGNVSSIAPMDVLHKLFVENEVCVLKMNPVNEHVGPHVERAFATLVEAGYLAVVYGGVDVGKRLTSHPLIDTLHVTGSDKTYDAIVWGANPEEQAKNKAAGTPINPRPFSAELGCVTPVLVVPGKWSESDLDTQARHVVGMVTQNASFNCNAAKVLLTAKGWDQREAFLAKVREHMKLAPARKAYYPGAQQRFEGFLSRYPQAERLGEARDGAVPWTFIPGVGQTPDEYALSNEAFCGVLTETALEATDAASFIDRAVPFANDRCWGTLSCMIIVDPKTESSLGERFERAIDELRYGGVAVNVWAALNYGLVSTTWGAFPGHPPEDIRSGAGVVHNTFLFDHPERSIVRGPFRPNPKPVWFPDHQNLKAVGERLVAMEASPGIGGLLSIALAAFKA